MAGNDVTSLENELANVTEQIEEYRSKIKLLNVESSTLEYYLKNDKRGDIAMANDLGGSWKSAEDGYDIVFTAVVNDQEYNSKGIPLETRFLARIDANNVKAARLEQELNSSGLLEKQASLSSQLEQAKATQNSIPVTSTTLDSNYYTNQLIQYNDNYNDAKRKMNNIITSLNNLYKAFNGASGSEVNKVKSALSGLLESLEGVNKKIESTQNKSIQNAESCYRCYNKWQNNSEYTNVYIDESDGYVCGVKYEPSGSYSEPSLLESLLFSTARAETVDMIEHKATIDEMLNS